MEDLFRSYWWLLFPVGWFVYSGWASWLNYRRQRATLDIVRRYADSGKEVPPELMKVLDKPIDSDAEMWGSASYGSARPTNYWSLFGLFAVLAGGFGIAAYMPQVFGVDMGVRFPFTVVALTMGAVAVWALISALTTRRDGS
ncbi:hypothetical protein [Brevundimonas sp.]|uniref:hypothetical protein n=1 Tax=Brevundimonas sp. TaxID=1871086 RepID=UPI001DC5D28B|nr:hypothetical protein [Brevundimonas sp.]MBA4000561.1 hypothetical protein [Brevundimonas sp.]